MINLKELRWSNCFSYGKNNKINFVKNQLTQLVGRNGDGKSSVALILEEVLFNKNSKGIKKADILNRYVKDKTYSIELDFSKDGVDYKIQSTRGTTQTVKLYRGDQDISDHTATATYKIIEQILGFDHKMFAQIVYQSNAGSLEFLTATDTNRKKFLIELLSLDVYVKAQDVFKEAATNLSKDIASTQSKVSTVKTWLDKYEGTNLDPMPVMEVPALDTALLTKVSELETSISRVDSTNKKIVQNNGYKTKLSTLSEVEVPELPQQNVDAKQVEELLKQKAESSKTIKDSELFIGKIAKLHGVCPTCLQDIDTHKIGELVSEQEAIKQKAQEQLDAAAAEYQRLSQLVKEYDVKLQERQKAIANNQEYKQYSQLVDSDLPNAVLVQKDLEQELQKLVSSISDTKARIKAAEAHNTKAAAHNSKVELVTKQLAEMQAELELYSGTLHELSERMGILNILTKTFSTSGLVAYKIESLVKDLEDITNQYLVALSDGRFQLSFKISASDKLNVVISDSSRDIDIAALSGGERARVNVATLLAIRKLMQSLSSSRINLLILDETVEALDVDGKERLVEVLLNEEYLNTFLVSHGFTHPLLEKVHVVKTNNISNIEG